jgi:hypothetical protein
MGNARTIFARTGLLFLGLDVVPLAMVTIAIHQDGPGNIPAILVGGVIGEYGFLLARSRLREKVLAGAAVPTWISAGGPELRERLLRAYSPVPTVLLTGPYFLVTLAYGLGSLPWSPIHKWENLLGAAIYSGIAAAGLANGAQWLYFSWLVARIDQPSSTTQ